MVSASFVTLFVWLTVIFAVFSLLALAGDMVERRQRRRAREELRAVRAYRDSLEPKRWSERSAA